MISGSLSRGADRSPGKDRGEGLFEFLYRVSGRSDAAPGDDRVRANEHGAAGFIRLDAIGLAINHWAFLGFADYLLDDGWRLGGAAVVPVRRDTYLRLSIAAHFDDGAAAGIGLEHDLW